MISTKITTINPQPSGVNQKLVPAKKYNELWDDVHRLDLKSYVPSIIVDKGLGPTVIQVTLSPVSVGLSGISSAAFGVISADDFLRSIHYVGDRPLIYSIKFSGDPLWVSNASPSLATIAVDHTTVGAYDVLVKVGDGLIESNPDNTVKVVIVNAP